MVCVLFRGVTSGSRTHSISDRQVEAGAAGTSVRGAPAPGARVPRAAPAQLSGGERGDLVGTRVNRVEEAGVERDVALGEAFGELGPDARRADDAGTASGLVRGV